MSSERGILANQHPWNSKLILNPNFTVNSTVLVRFLGSPSLNDGIVILYLTCVYDSEMK